MKKLIFVLMLACISTLAKAESYIGGTVGFGLEKLSTDGYSMTSNVFKFAVEGGHHLNDVWAIGGSIGLNYENIEGLNGTKYLVLPYLRGTFAHAGIVDFFGEVALGYGCDTADGISASYLTVGLRPGFVVNTSKKFCLLCRTTLLSYNHYSNINDLGLAINGNLELGFMFKF